MITDDKEFHKLSIAEIDKVVKAYTAFKNYTAYQKFIKDLINKSVVPWADVASFLVTYTNEYNDEGYDGECFITGFNDSGEHICSRDISGTGLPVLHTYTDEESQPQILQFMFSIVQPPTCPELYIRL